MTDYFVNLIASGENMRTAYWVYVLLLVIGAAITTRLDTKSHDPRPFRILWFMFIATVSIFGFLTVDKTLHDALNERNKSHMVLFQEDGRNIALIRHEKRSRENINDEFGEWETYDITISEQYKNYLIQELN